MFLQRHFIFLLIIIIISSGVFAAIHDEEYLSKNGPFGLVTFTKNDTFVDWVRIPEVNYKQWIYALKFWRTCSITVGILCLIFASLVLAYIIHGFQTNSSGPFGCFGDVKFDDRLETINPNLQQFDLSHQLKIAQQREQEAQRQKYEAERRLSAILRNSPSSAIFTNQMLLKT